MDGATFSWVLTFLALSRESDKTENFDNIYATLVITPLLIEISTVTF